MWEDISHVYVAVVASEPFAINNLEKVGHSVGSER